MNEDFKILIADDEHFIRKLTSRILTTEGYHVIQAENGREAVRLYDEHSDEIKMAVLDIRMPDMTGIEVYRHMNSLNPSIRVILCSGYGDDDVPSDCKDYFIQKPFSLQDFVDTVRRVLQAGDEEIAEHNKKLLRLKGNCDEKHILSGIPQSA